MSDAHRKHAELDAYARGRTSGLAEVKRWEARARKRYKQWQDAKCALERVEQALREHDACWPDCPCLELAADIRRAMGGAA